MQVWQRPEEPGAQQRKRQPIAEQASDRWLAGYRGACAITQACPTTLVVTMADRDRQVDSSSREADGLGDLCESSTVQ